MCQQGEDTRGEHNLSMYIQTTAEHYYYYYYIVLLLFLAFCSELKFVGVCAEVTLLQQRALLSSLVFQSQQLLLPING